MTFFEARSSFEQSARAYWHDFPKDWKGQAFASFCSSALVSLLVYQEPTQALTMGTLSAICSIAFAALSPLISSLYHSENGQHRWPQVALRVNLSLLIAVVIGTFTSSPLSPLSVATMMAIHNLVRENSPSKSAIFFFWS